VQRDVQRDILIILFHANIIAFISCQVCQPTQGPTTGVYNREIRDVVSEGLPQAACYNMSQNVNMKGLRATLYYSLIRSMTTSSSQGAAALWRVLTHHAVWAFYDWYLLF